MTVNSGKEAGRGGDYMDESQPSVDREWSGRLRERGLREYLHFSVSKRLPSAGNLK